MIRNFSDPHVLLEQATSAHLASTGNKQSEKKSSILLDLLKRCRKEMNNIQITNFIRVREEVITIARPPAPAAWRSSNTTRTVSITAATQA